MIKLDAALEIASLGLPVFPIKPGEKAPPLVTSWPERAATDEPTIRALWGDAAGEPNANIGIHCDGLLVLDIDVRNDGEASLLDLEIANGALPRTMETLTPTGGRHIFLKLPAGHPGVANGAGKLGSGIDIKSTRGYVIAPGSDVAAGRYQFNVIAPIADAPDWLVQLCGVSAKREQAPPVNIPDARDDVMDRAYDWLKHQPRGDDAFKTTCGLRDMGLSEHQAYLLMLSHDGRAPEIVREKVAHAYRYAKSAPGARAVTPDSFDVVGPAVTPAADIKSNSKPTDNTRANGPVQIDAFARQVAGGPGYLAKGLLSKHSYAVLYGASGEGKTFAALDLGMAVATGRPFLGHPTRQGAVLYVGFEAFGGLPRRAAALQAKYQTAGAPLYFLPGVRNVRVPEGARAFAAEVGMLPEKPTLIIIDTMAYALMGADENSNTEIQQFNNTMQNLIAATGATVLLIHHTGKDEAKGARGAYALKAAVDTEILVSDRKVLAMKQRDMESAPPASFRLVPVTVGLDQDGDTVTSCYVEQVAAPPASNSVTARMAPNSDLARGWEKLIELRPTNEPITETEWMEGCREFLGEGRRAKKQFYDIKTRLKGRRLIAIDEDGLIRRRME